MTPTKRAILQKSLLDAMRAAAGPDRPSNGELADEMGCDRTEISRFENGSRRLDVDELVAGMEAYDCAEAVLGVLAARFGLRVVPDVAARPVEVGVPQIAELSARAASLTVSFIEMERDGLDARERRALAADLEHIAQKVANARAGLVAS